MTTSRIPSLEALRERNPDDTRVLFALALEHEKLEHWDDVASILQDYLGRTDDQGNGWGRLGNALFRLGRTDDARVAFRKGVEAARSHGHPGMAEEFEEALEQLDG